MTTAKPNNLTRAAELGQAVWLDQISRDLIDKGEIRDLVDAGLPGHNHEPDHL